MANGTFVVTDSILDTIRHMLGLEATCTHFDQEIVVNINMALSILYQLGLGEDALSITGPSETWDDLFGDRADVGMIKTWIYLKVKMAFDPPSSSFTAEAYDKQIKELEWRINAAVDPAFE